MTNVEKKNGTPKAVKVNKTATTKATKATKTEPKAVAPKKAVKTAEPKKEATKKVATPKATKATKVKTEEPKTTPQVALAINKKFCGINLFFADRKFKTDDDSTFMKSKMGMRWNNTDQCWYVKFKTEAQLSQVIDYFGDRLWLPEDLDSQVAEVLGAMSKRTSKPTAPKVSFKTLVGNI